MLLRTLVWALFKLPVHDVGASKVGRIQEIYTLVMHRTEAWRKCKSFFIGGFQALLQSSYRGLRLIQGGGNTH